jgi:hypothetical protein
VERVRVLLSEGSSLTAREVLTCLGAAGYHVEALDPDPLRVPVAVADVGSFGRVQSKIEFAYLLDELGLPQPRW